MKCPARTKFCTPSAIRRYPCKSWFCSGTKVRKAPGGVKMDVIRVCGKTFFMKGECFLECTPDEAIQISALLSQSAEKFLSKFKPYDEFLEKNNK